MISGIFIGIAYWVIKSYLDKNHKEKMDLERKKIELLQAQVSEINNQKQIDEWKRQLYS